MSASDDEDFFFALALNAPMYVSIANGEGTWLWSFNDSPRLSDLTSEEIPVADNERLQLVVRSVASGAQDSVPVRIHIKDREGLLQPYVVIVKNLKHEPALGAIGLYAYDASDQEYVEKRAELLNSSLGALIEHIDTALLLHDTAHNVVHVNQMFMDLFKVADPIESTIGRPLVNLYPAARIRFIDQAAADVEGYTLIAGGKEALNREWVTTDGKIICRDYIPVKLHGAIKGHLWLFRDITPK